MDPDLIPKHFACAASKKSLIRRMLLNRLSSIPEVWLDRMKNQVIKRRSGQFIKEDFAASKASTLKLHV